MFPAIDIQKSGTRKKELLIAKEDLNRGVDGCRQVAPRITRSTRIRISVFRVFRGPYSAARIPRARARAY